MLKHARQTSLANRNIDTFHRMMERSDPIVLGMIGSKKSKIFVRKDPFPQVVIDMCQSPDELIESSKLKKHAEKTADICARPHLYLCPKCQNSIVPNNCTCSCPACHELPQNCTCTCLTCENVIINCTFSDTSGSEPDEN